MYKRLSLIAYLCIIILPFFLNSCDKDEPTASKNEDTSFDEKYQRVVSEMESIQRSLSSASTVDAIMDALKTNPIVKGAVFNEQDSLVMVTLASGFSMKVDVTAPIPQYITTDDDLKKEELVADSIDSLFSDFDLTEPPHEEVQTKTVPLVRAFNPSGKFLRKRNVLLICFDPEFVMEDKDLMKRSIAAANKESQVGSFRWDYDTITKYTPQYFAKAKQYDFVFISAHGNEDGELFFPVTGMSESLKKTYTKMAESPNTTGVWLATKTVGRREVITGFWLAKEFFSQYFGEMSHSIVWTSKCYAGSNLSDIRLAFVSHCKVLEFFGASQPCNGGEVGRIFKTYLKFMSKGMSCKDAFWETPKRGEWYKPLEIGTYGRSNDCQWRYATPQATGVKKRLTRAIDDKPADNVTVGVRYRYSVDANNNPINSAEGGIRLTDLQTNASIDLPMNTENSVIVSSYRIGDNFVISDIDVTLSGLIANHQYRYQAYAKDSETTVVSDQNYEFTAPTQEVYEIYNEEDFRRFINSLNWTDYSGKTVKVMNDVKLTIGVKVITENVTDINSCNLKFNGIFDGGGHMIEFAPPTIKGNISMIPIISSNGIVRNFKFNISRSSRDYGWYYMIYSNYGKIEDVEHIHQDNGHDLYGGLICTNYGIIQNCRYGGHPDFSFDFVSENFGNIYNCEFNAVLNTPYKHEDLAGPRYYRSIGSNRDSGQIINSKINCSAANAFCYNNEGLISGCHFYGNKNVKSDLTDYHNIIHFNTGKISGCSFDMDVDTECVIPLIHYNSGFLDSNEIYGKNTYFAEENVGIINNCDNLCTVLYNRSSICSENKNGGVIQFCKNRCTVYSSSGICLSNRDGGTIKACENYADLYMYQTYGGGGGICCYNYGGKIYNCVNHGNINTNSSDGIYGITSNYDEGNVKSCINFGKLRYYYDSKNEFSRIYITQIAESYSPGCGLNGRCEVYIDGVLIKSTIESIKGCYIRGEWYPDE